MPARCSFCSADLPEAPPGAAVRCASCGNLTMTPRLADTASLPAMSAPVAPAAAGLPFSSVDGRKASAASPPPSTVLPSRAGGVDELVGGGITILGIGLLKLVLFGMGGSLLFCVLGMLGFAFHC